MTLLFLFPSPYQFIEIDVCKFKNKFDNSFFRQVAAGTWNLGYSVTAEQSNATKWKKNLRERERALKR